MCAARHTVLCFSVQCGIRPGAVPSPYNGQCIALCRASRCISCVVHHAERRKGLNIAAGNGTATQLMVCHGILPN